MSTDAQITKSEGRDSKSCEGARKVALFLSILEPETAEALLSLFPPEISREIASEALHVKRVLPEDVDSVVSEFLNSVGYDALGEELTNALVDEARRRKGTRIVDSVDWTTLAHNLASERNSICAVALSMLSQDKRAEVLSAWNVHDREVIAKCRSVLKNDWDGDEYEGVKRLEDVLFEWTLNDE